MGVKIRKLRGKYYLVIDHRGKRKKKAIGTDRNRAKEAKERLEAKLRLGDTGILGRNEEPVPTFGAYADKWMRDYAQVECKKSTAQGYEGILGQYLRPLFGNKPLKEIRRDDLKEMINDLIGRDLSRNTIRNVICVVRKMFNEALEAGLVESNPAARLGRFTRTAKTPETKGVSLTQDEVLQFLEAANDVCPEYYPLFLAAVRAGLRRGESAPASMTPTASSWCSTITSGENTRQRRARSRVAWTSRKS